MTDDKTYIVPNKEDTSIASEDSKEPMFEKFKNLLKLLKPDNLTLTPNWSWKLRMVVV